MSIEVIVVIAAIFISWLVFKAFVDVVKTSVKTAVSIALVVLVLQITFGIRSEEILQQIFDLPRLIWQFFAR